MSPILGAVLVCEFCHVLSVFTASAAHPCYLGQEPRRWQQVMSACSKFNLGQVLSVFSIRKALPYIHWRFSLMMSCYHLGCQHFLSLGRYPGASTRLHKLGLPWNKGVIGLANLSRKNSLASSNRLSRNFCFGPGYLVGCLVTTTHTWSPSTASLAFQLRPSKVWLTFLSTCLWSSIL